MPRWSELRRFCENDGWELFKQTDHYYYRKIMAQKYFMCALQVAVKQGCAKAGFCW